MPQHAKIGKVWTGTNSEQGFGSDSPAAAPYTRIALQSGRPVSESTRPSSEAEPAPWTQDTEADSMAAVRASQVRADPSTDKLLANSARDILARHGVTGEAALGQSWMLFWIAEVFHKILDSAPAMLFDQALEPARRAPVMALHIVNSDDVRGSLLKLETLLKDYAKKFPALKALNEELIKPLEDVIGQYNDAAWLHSLAEAVRDNAGRVWSVEDSGVLAQLGQFKASTQASLESIVASHWLPDVSGRLPALSGVINSVMGEHWLSARKDRSFLAKRMAKRAKKLTTRGYDMGDVEAGIHRYRKDMRWLALQVVAAPGLVRFDAQTHPIPEYRELALDPGWVAHKYAQVFPTLDAVPPIVISHSLYLALTREIEVMGGLKDTGQLVEGKALAFLKSGVSAAHESATESALEFLGLEPTALDDALAQATLRLEEANIERDLHGHLARAFARQKK